VDQATWDEFFDTAKSELNQDRLNAEFERLWEAGAGTEGKTEPLIADEEKRLAEKPLDWLLEQCESRPRNEAPKRRSQESAAYDRDPIVVALRKRLAGYQCEVDGCQSEQFKTESGDLFVEVHHLVQLADGGRTSWKTRRQYAPHIIVSFTMERSGSL
jgi:hypothetical protein